MHLSSCRDFFVGSVCNQAVIVGGPGGISKYINFRYIQQCRLRVSRLGGGRITPRTDPLSKNICIEHRNRMPDTTIHFKFTFVKYGRRFWYRKGVAAQVLFSTSAEQFTTEERILFEIIPATSPGENYFTFLFFLSDFSSGQDFTEISIHERDALLLNWK